MRKTLKNEIGITLVSLVISIIILLILAGIGLGAIAEKDSLVKKAQETADEYERAAGEEADTVNDLLNILP